MIKSALATCLLLAGCATATVPSGATPTAKEIIIRYELDGSATVADITYETPTGTAQQTDIGVPLIINDTDSGMEFAGFDHGDSVYFSAQNRDDYGDLTCRILQGSEIISENTAYGGYAIATCEASVS